MVDHRLHEQLVDAVCDGNANATATLIARGADPNYQNAQINTVLMWAATHGRIEAARVLHTAIARMLQEWHRNAPPDQPGQQEKWSGVNKIRHP